MSTADFVRHRDASLRTHDRVSALEGVVGADKLSIVAANQLADKLLGNTIYANVLMLGFAWQKGLLPLSLAAIMRAVELNGVEIEKNKAALQWGRLAAGDMSQIETLIAPVPAIPAKSESLEEMIGRRADFLVGYQDEALSDRFLSLVEKVRNAEQRVGDDRSDELTRAVARAYFKTLAYKDEYEVARLHTQTEFLGNLRSTYGNTARLRFHLAPPLLSNKKDARGRPLKREFGAWIIPVFRVLSKLKGLRGTAFDPFGYTDERKMERALITEFEQVVDKIVDGLSADSLEIATVIINMFMDIRGYGPVKDQAAEKTLSDIKSRLDNYTVSQREAA